MKQDLAELKKDHIDMNEWLKKVGEILCPIVDDDDFSRGNSSNVIGKIE